MNVTKYESTSRGVGEAGWLRSRFSFSFANYFNPARMGFGALRVLNDDSIEGGGGFGMHPHRDMEIITLVTHGTLEHKDSLGNVGILTPGEVQVMSAGTGITHSEYNQSATEPLALFQMWIETKEPGIAPRYDQKRFVFQPNTLITVASGRGDADALVIHQDARILVGTFQEGGEAQRAVVHGSGVFVFVIEGSFEVLGTSLGPRDALEVTECDVVSLITHTGGQIMLIEVPM